MAGALIACGTPTSSAPATPSVSRAATAATPAAASPSAQPGARLAVATSRYGNVLVDGSGRALYLFDIEREPVPKCYGACAVSWPPMLATTASTSDPELNPALVGLAERNDGSRQVTFNGHPLYYYVGDRSPGEIKCQAVIEFGGGWYVISPQGNKITAR